MVNFVKKPYIIINILLAGVIVLIMIYSAVFSPDEDEYPVVCIHERITGEPCVSCGLSHSFSLILRGRLNEAYNWNVYGMRVFLFFMLQLIMRVFFSFFYIKFIDTRKQLIMMDIIGSVLLFLISFRQFFAYIFQYC
jgi:hypothetical protein